MSDRTTRPLEHPFCGDVVSTVTRAQALEDGVLMDAGSTAREAGLRRPVALAAAAWDECVSWTDGDSAAQVPQDPEGRLGDVLFSA